jgi:NTP pyrophosphatase (non-canonical NTP hydrolase)
MEIKEAQKIVDETIKQYGGYWEPLSMLARLTEEVGELARALNQKFGGKKKKFEGDGKEIKDELADVLYTLLALANNLEIKLDEEFERKVKESHEKYKEVYSK